VGHSYGAAIALQIALTYPERVASLTLYEPAQFLLLFADGLNSPEGREILALRKFMHENMKSPIGRWSVAKKYIDYWSGEGSWNKMSFLRRRALVSLMPKVAAEFEAILSANVSAADFADLNMPVRLILGSETHATARKVTEVLNDVLPIVELVTVDGAEHMAPATQAANINPLFAGHVVATMERQYSIAA
jgi:pimeloyl-ACP methyl ester carboxylesterase